MAGLLSKMRYYKHTHRHIHRILKKHAPSTIHKAKRLVAFKYPKFLLLTICIIAAYYLFSLSSVKDYISGLGQLGYFTNLIAGILFSFGFTTPFSMGFLITIAPKNILIASIISGVGSLIGDMIIFKTIKISFIDEFRELEKKKALKKIREIVEHNRHILIRHYLVYIFAGIILASPIPDEVGVSMLAGLTTVKPKIFALISFILHTIGFYIIISLGMQF